MKSTMHWQPTRHAHGSSMLSNLSFIALLFLNLFCYNLAKADYDTSTIPYGFSFPSGTFEEGDLVSIGIWAGNSNEVLHHVGGFDLKFYLTEHAVFPNSVQLSFVNSWITGGEEMPYSTLLDPDNLAINFHALDTELSESGYGEIARFTLICNTNGVSAQQMMASMGGGIIIQIDDLGTRLGRNIHENAPLSFNVYPNPNQGKIIIEDQASQMSHWILRDVYGKELREGTQLRINFEDIGLPPGIYVLSLRTRDGRYVNKKLSYSPR